MSDWQHLTPRSRRQDFLKNRFYLGEVVYRGETHSGEHASIIDHPTFEAVQVKLADNARARRVCIESSPAILMGRIFDDRGNPGFLARSE